MSELQVLVTGAGGQTGKIILEKLLDAPDRFSVRGLVHSEQVHKFALLLQPRESVRATFFKCTATDLIGKSCWLQAVS